MSKSTSANFLYNNQLDKVFDDQQLHAIIDHNRKGKNVEKLGFCHFFIIFQAQQYCKEIRVLFGYYSLLERERERESQSAEAKLIIVLSSKPELVINFLSCLSLSLLNLVLSQGKQGRIQKFQIVWRVGLVRIGILTNKCSDRSIEV